MRFDKLASGLTLGLGLGAAVLTSCSSGSSKNAEFNTTRGGSGGNGGSGGGSGGKSATGGTSGDAGENGSGAAAGDPGSGGAGGTSGATGSGGSAGVPSGAGVGDDCSVMRCRQGLACIDATCTPNGDGQPGEPCVIQPECASGLQCSGGTCAPEGDSGVGEACAFDSDCEAELRCVFAGLNATCAPQGDRDLGDDCTLGQDCYQGLACFDGACTPQPHGGPLWPGVECEGESTEDVRAFFEVPGAEGALEGDFFRLPFPNDARLGPNGLNLDGFPTPGAGLLGVDPVALYVDALEQNDQAWGNYGTVTFRFSGLLDVVSMQTQGSVAWVDITPGAAEFDSSVGLGWYYSAGKGTYVCEHWVSMRRPRGYPLLANHTYAVYFTTNVKADGGGTIHRPPNLISLLEDDAPSDPVLVPVHGAYAPLRDYLLAKSIDRSSILNATVFTVGPTLEPMEELASAIAARPVPTASDWTLCDTGVDSPCPDATGDRACGASTADYDEYHALVTLPIFQDGTPPYITPADGGGIGDVDDPDEAEVCLALTVPKGTAPASGFPLVVYAHGTGGSFRDHATASVAGALSSGGVKFAVLGIDQVSHGPRRGSSIASPEDLFFNFLNPAAARGNPLQGAADQLSLMRFAATIDGTNGAPAAIDPNHLYFFGHSQGSTEGSLMLPFADGYKAAVLSGNGASLLNALLTKSKPVNIRGLLPLVLSDTDVAGALGEFHPVLSLLQQWIDPADPLNFARSTVREPLMGHPAKHLFQTYGLGDSYSPPDTLAIYAIAGQITQVEPVLTTAEIGTLVVPAPLSANELVGTITSGVRQYEPATGDDGHFVVFDVQQANDDMVRFFSMAASGDIPQIGE